jgi:3'-phosphoadenosine 5'-phosphosulfate sulfotransferase (PAPS reductase)/FAD synthetase
VSVIHVISYSTGKDSDETLRQAIARQKRKGLPMDRIHVAFCDTDNEHELAHQHLTYIELRHDIKVIRLRADFTAELAAKREFIARDVRHGRQYRRVPKVDRFGRPVYLRDKAGALRLFPVLDDEGDETGELAPLQAMGWDGGRRIRWSNKAKRRALTSMYPSGNAFLDLCMWKGRFPSRKAQFCTQELKTALLVQYQQALVEQGHRVVSWQGVRRDESANRANALRFERLQPRTYAYRPLVDWTAMQVFASLAAHGIEPNALYRQNMTRVGCMPCINVNKPELREIAMRWPHVIDRIAAWERSVGDCSKRGFSTFMTDAHGAQDRREIFADLNIRSRVEWAKTTRGGRQFDLLLDEEPKACASAYGLCE